MHQYWSFVAPRIVGRSSLPSVLITLALAFVSPSVEALAMARGRYSDDVGDRALDVAVQTCDYENAKILLRRGADPDATVEHSDDGKYPTILGWAILTGCQDLVQLLLDNGASVLKRHPAAEENKGRSDSNLWLTALPLEQAIGALSFSNRGSEGQTLDRWKIVDLILRAGARRLGTEAKLVHLDRDAAITRARSLVPQLRKRVFDRLGV